MKMTRIFSVFLAVLLASPVAALAVDYDYEAARQRWQAAQQDADRAANHLNSENARLTSAQRELDAAVAEERTLTNQLTSVRTSIRRTDDQIASKESSRRQKVNEREQAQNQIANLTTEIQSFDHAILALGSEIRAMDNEINRLTREISRLEGQDPDHPDLPSLRRELENAKREQTRLVNEQRNLQNQRNQRINQRQSLYDRVTTINGNIATLDREIDQLYTDRRQLVATEQDTELSLSRVRSVVADCRARRDNVQLDVDRAAFAYQQADNRAQEAKRYYEQVLANYNHAMNSAVALGTSSAQRDSGREAEERSQALAASDGEASALVRGRDAGAGEARLISEAQGYNHGLQNGASDDALRNSYNSGIDVGKGIAASKAQAETFPAGYNSEMNERFARSPSGAETVDITDRISDEPGDAAASLLEPTAKPIGNVRPPAFLAKAEPPYAPPAAAPGNPNVPAPDFRYYRVECGNQPLPVFDQACRQAYDRTYAGDFSSLYRSAYARIFRSAYASHIDAPYSAARQTRVGDVFAAAALAGAKDKGTLDGFSSEIANARSVAEQNGRRAFVSYLETGFLPLLRSVVLIEDYLDDNLSPGEKFQVQIVVDNYGLKSTPREKLRLRLKEVSGGSFVVDFRALPSLNADTTTTLVGVLPGLAGSQAIPLSLDAVLELDLGGDNFEVLDEARLSRGISLPLELSGVRFARSLPVGAEETAEFTFTNKTSRTINDRTVALSVNAEIVSLTDAQVQLPELEPGASATVPVRMTATAMAGGNQLYEFSVDAGALAGTSNLNLTKATVIPVARNASINLCLSSCTTPYQVPLKVRAGGSLVLPAQFTFLSNQRQQGPFEIGKLQTSDNRIGATNGSTLRASLGSWGPNNAPYRANFGYTFPVALRGQTHWVSLYIKEGSRQIHVLKVPVLVE